MSCLPRAVRSRLVIENDDRTYSAKDTLKLCQKAGVPMVFDLHHHLCRNDGEDFRDLLPDIFATWRDRPPKVHLSSPKDGQAVPSPRRLRRPGGGPALSGGRRGAGRL